MLDNNVALQRRFFQGRSYGLTFVQVILLLSLLGFGILLISITISIGTINTIFIYTVLVSAGFFICHRTCVRLDDPNLRILGTFWLIKIAATLIVLYLGWMPQLDPSSISWGYDPQRFYLDAWDLVENGWNPLAQSSYQGIIFYYGAIFFLFGHNPVIPALINAFVTLLGTLFLIRFIYSLVPNRSSKDWTIAGLLLIPEMIWYDVLTARETLMAALIIFTLLSIGRYLVSVKYVSVTKILVIAGISTIAILAVRTLMIIPIVCSVGAMQLLLKSKRKMRPLIKLFLLIFAIGVVMAGPIIQSLAGGSEISYLKALDNVQTIDSNIAYSAEWGSNSIGLLISPKNTLEAVLFLPLRMILYLAAPLPNIAISVTELINGSWYNWQNLMTIPTSGLILLTMPYALAGTTYGWRIRNIHPGPMVVLIAFWIVFIAVAGGNIIIHERYRLMFTLLLFASMWLGYTRCSSREIYRWNRIWFSLLTMLTIFFAAYKFF